ncbi:NmrA family NAD(P)-binding protein [Algoriphagus antarcticus]|uniref:Uncharacterized protein YbjT (DUF2867 family) n=1 Tax=Algoriphagus antarcticus TaxID=238540 RepID=A0A3E0DW11_9BACT|nr:NmrA family NAD(P)-binding protein [Algoriphagus antarcticus]REG90287.1 uncharacterized protein YbjT (DUF2867 family) [Algoriphagus antarcticus]
MTRVLVTGATGNIGREVIHYLCRSTGEIEVIAGVRDIRKAQHAFSEYTDLAFSTFDFDDERSFYSAFENIDVLFLLRPPQISDVALFFDPLLKAAKEAGINKVVFLSVQGAEKSKVIPHNKIERLIKSFGFNYIFVRPSYFMQNLTTTLLPEIVKHYCITLPSGNAKFNWIDVANIGEASAILIEYFEKYQNSAYEITGSENRSFQKVTKLMSEVLGKKIQFKTLNPISFYFKKKKEGMPGDFALVMTILHFLPRLQSEPKITDDFHKLTGKKPTVLREFLEREEEKFLVI